MKQRKAGRANGALQQIEDVQLHQDDSVWTETAR